MYTENIFVGFADINKIMPKGFPPDVYVSKIIRQLGTRWNDNVHQAIVFFEIPSYLELRTCWNHAFSDSIVAYQSIKIFLNVSLRPLYILIAWISLHVWNVLQVVFKHTLHHTIQVLKRGGKQTILSIKKFIEFQKSLSREVVYMELAVLATVGVLYAIRRYIQRKRYVERLFHWYTVKRNHVQKRYQDLVDKIAETSLLIALLLPHVVYILGFGFIRYFLPSYVGYVASQTIFTTVISLGIPLIQTIALIAKWQHHEHRVSTSKDSSKMNQGMSESKKPIKVKEKEKGEEDTTTQGIFKDISNRLIYWIVYNVLVSSFQIIHLLPILGGFFPNGPDGSNTLTPSYTSRWFVRGKGVQSLSNFQLSNRTCEEIKLFFFLWLQLLSMGDYDHSTEVKSRSSPRKEHMKNKQSSQTLSSFNHSSLRLVYDQVKPFLRTVTNNVHRMSTIVPSSSPDQDLSDDHTSNSIIQRIIQWAGSFLDFLVWTKVLSKKNKNDIIKALAESIALFPALPSLFMPSYFAKFGIVYVSSIIPAVNSAYAVEVFQMRAESVNMSVRFLEYWVLHAILSSVVSSLTPIISWFPLNTHVQLLIWLLLQMELVSRTLYECFTDELIFFGVLKSPIDDHQRRSIIMRSIAYISNRLRGPRRDEGTKEIVNS